MAKTKRRTGWKPRAQTNNHQADERRDESRARPGDVPRSPDMSTTATIDPVEIESTRRQFDPAVIQGLPEAMEVASLGEGLKLVSSTIVELDKEFATMLLELPEFSSDRPLNDNHVATLKQAMERGTFLPEQVNIVTCSLDGKTYRMNGQHTSWARLYMPDNYKCAVRHFRYKADTENDMRRLYASLDRMKGRTTGNIVIAYLYDTPEWKGYNKRVITKLSEGLAYHLWHGKDERTMHDADDRAYLLMTDYHDLAKKVGPFLDESFGKSSRHLLRRPVIGAMFSTFEKAAQPSLDFWRAVRDGIGFTNKFDPRLTLRNALLQSSIKTPESVKRELVSFDRHKDFASGTYHLSPAPPIWSRPNKRSSGHAGGHGRKTNKIVHRTIRVRTTNSEQA